MVNLNEKMPIELICEDSLSAIKRLPNEAFKLVVTSPPYNIGKSYERNLNLTLKEYEKWLEPLVSSIYDVLSPDGHVCWQVGNHVRNGELFPLDYTFFNLFHNAGFKLRNRIVWRFNFGLNANRRFSGRYETLLWLTKGDQYSFNLDNVRVPQLYPGKRHSRGQKVGLPSGNPLGKNPGDFWEFEFDPQEAFFDNPVWDIPNVKARHPEKTEHPCQFPVELAERCVLALTQPGDWILDPFSGVGSSIIAARKNGRLAVGIEKEQKYIDVSLSRLDKLNSGDLETRPLGKPVRRPKAGERVSQVPDEWRLAAE
ncbi:MAG: DNA-methyltransferase [Niveispirillum sp.]|uniref:DNA-methyltransferase n=1 Tax=Niveispirillum sp. TaxID=1917217 RepID=UPI003BA80425